MILCVTTAGKSKTTIRKCNHHIKLQYCYDTKLVYYSETTDEGWQTWHTREEDSYWGEKEHHMYVLDTSTKKYDTVVDILNNVSPGWYFTAYDLITKKAYILPISDVGDYSDAKLLGNTGIVFTHCNQESTEDSDRYTKVYKIDGKQMKLIGIIYLKGNSLSSVKVTSTYVKYTDINKNLRHYTIKNSGSYEPLFYCFYFFVRIETE